MASTAPAAIGADPIAARLDALPVTPLHWAIVVVCALGLMFDVIEAALSNALSAVFSAPPHRVRAVSALAAAGLGLRRRRHRGAAARPAGGPPWTPPRARCRAAGPRRDLAARRREHGYFLADDIPHAFSGLRARRLSAADGRVSLRRATAARRGRMILLCGGDRLSRRTRGGLPDSLPDAARAARATRAGAGRW